MRNWNFPEFSEDFILPKGYNSKVGQQGNYSNVIFTLVNQLSKCAEAAKGHSSSNGSL